MAKGFVYILRNEAMPGLLKIGYSVKVPTERVAELFTTGVPEPFRLTYYCLAENAEKLETEIHRHLSEHRHRGDREFFRVELETAVQSISALCKPEHEWYEEQPQSLSELAGISQRAPCDGQIAISSRDEREGEIREMESFVEAATQRSLARYVRSLFYDSNSCCCYFELSSEVEPYGQIAGELLEIALETIGQFEWFGYIQHGRPNTEF